MKASDIMTSNPEVVTPAESVVHAAEIMRDCEIGFVPVVADRESMRLLGVITDRDIAVRHVAERLQRAGARRQQVAPDQVREPEIGVGRDQRLDALRREVEPIRIDRLQHARQRLLGLGGDAGAGKRRKQGAQKQRAAAQRPILSWRICQRPSLRASSRVFIVELALSTSER